MNLVIYGFMVMFPYKLSRGSNATRYVYAVLAIGGLIFSIGAPAATVPLFSRISSYIQLPILAISLFWLFTPTSNKWFSGATAQDSSNGDQRRT